MSLLIVAVVFLVVHFVPGWCAIRRAAYHGLFRLAHAGLERIGLWNGLGVLLFAMLIVALVSWAQISLVSLPVTWPWFAFSLVALLLAWGGRDLDDDVEQFLAAETELEARTAAAVLLHSYDQHTVSGPEAVIKGVFYQSLVRWFGVLFWFMVFGAAGAIAFRLPHALLSSAWVRERASVDQFSLLRRITRIIDLPPAVLSVLALALVGNFDAVTAAWREHAAQRSWYWSLDTDFLPSVGLRLVADDAENDEAFSHAYAGSRAPVSAAMSLLWRALMAWLTFIALLIIAGLVS